MKNKTMFILIIIFVIASFSIYSYYNLAEADKFPTISISPTDYDFGDIPYEIVKKDFTVKNLGDEVLIVKAISTSCGCTKGTIESESLLPGRETKLTVTFDPNLMGDDLRGPVERFVYVKSNDPINPEVEIELKANIVV